MARGAVGGSAHQKCSIVWKEERPTESSSSLTTTRSTSNVHPSEITSFLLQMVEAKTSTVLYVRLRPFSPSNPQSQAGPDELGQRGRPSRQEELPPSRQLSGPLDHFLQSQPLIAATSPSSSSFSSSSSSASFILHPNNNSSSSLAWLDTYVTLLGWLLLAFVMYLWVPRGARKAYCHRPTSSSASSWSFPMSKESAPSAAHKPLTKNSLATSSSCYPCDARPDDKSRDAAHRALNLSLPLFHHAAPSTTLGTVADNTDHEEEEPFSVSTVQDSILRHAEQQRRHPSRADREASSSSSSSSWLEDSQPPSDSSTISSSTPHWLTPHTHHHYGQTRPLNQRNRPSLHPHALFHDDEEDEEQEHPRRNLNPQPPHNPLLPSSSTRGVSSATPTAAASWVFLGHPAIPQLPPLNILQETMRRLHDRGVRLTAHGVQSDPKRVWIRLDRNVWACPDYCERRPCTLQWQTEFPRRITTDSHTGQGSLVLMRGTLHDLPLVQVVYIDVGKKTSALIKEDNVAIPPSACFSLLTATGSLDLQSHSKLERDALVTCLSNVLDQVHGSTSWRVLYEESPAPSQATTLSHSGASSSASHGTGQSSDFFVRRRPLAKGTAPGLEEI